MINFKKAICIINFSKPQALEIAEIVISYLTANGLEFILPAGPEGPPGYSAYQLDALGSKLASMPEAEKPDIALIMGGDGTIIHSARVLSIHGIPLLGINLGKLGFLTAIELANLQDALENLVAGDYFIEDRMLLWGEVMRYGERVHSGSAQNDLVINSDISRTIGINLFIDDHLAMSFIGDGLVLATPTGSTAYSLSAGGPIVVPNSELIVATPISPHNLYARPIIADGNSVIRVVMGFKNRVGKITFDGQGDFRLEPKDEVIISKYKNHAKFVWIEESTFLTNLHRKLGNSI